MHLHLVFLEVVTYVIEADLPYPKFILFPLLAFAQGHRVEA